MLTKIPIPFFLLSEAGKKMTGLPTNFGGAGMAMSAYYHEEIMSNSN